MSETPARVLEHVTRYYPQAYVHPASGEIALPHCVRGVSWWMRVTASDGRLTVVSQCHVMTPRERRAQMAELIGRLNSKLETGRFEVDMDGDGEVRFRTNLRYGRMDLDQEVIEGLIAMHLVAVPRCWRAFVAVAWEKVYAENAEHLTWAKVSPASGLPIDEDVDAAFGELLAAEERTRQLRREMMAEGLLPLSDEEADELNGRPATGDLGGDKESRDDDIDASGLRAARARLLACLRALAARGEEAE